MYRLGFLQKCDSARGSFSLIVGSRVRMQLKCRADLRPTRSTTGSMNPAFEQRNAVADREAEALIALGFASQGNWSMTLSR